jgi:hypothetical protein
MIDKFAELIKEKIRKDMNDLADQLANGRVKTMEDYRYTCGVLRGLYIAEEYIAELLEQAQQNE